MRILVVDGSKGNMQALYLFLMSEAQIDGIIVDGGPMEVSNVHLVIKEVSVDVPVLESLPSVPVDLVSMTNRMKVISTLANQGLVKSIFLYSHDGAIPNLPVQVMEVLLKQDITNEMISHARMMGMSQPLIRGVLLKEEWYNWNFYHLAAAMFYMKSRTSQSLV